STILSSIPRPEQGGVSSTRSGASKPGPEVDMDIAFSRGLAPVLSASLLLAIPPASAPTPPHVYVFGRASFVTGNSPIALARGDLDGDGIADVVAVDGQDDAISVLLGTAQGSFQPKVDYAAGTEPDAIALGDLDLNGTLDAVVVDQNCPSGTCGPGAVSVLL